MEDEGQLIFDDAVEVLPAHAIRDRSHDIDLYATGLDDRAIIETTARFASRFGPQFKIDATPSKMIFGAIVLADIILAGSALVAACRANGSDPESVADLRQIARKDPRRNGCGWAH